MALPFPEGECFFNRSGISGPETPWYQANLAEHFYKHFLIEYIWNEPFNYNTSTIRSHPRSDWSLFKWSGSKTQFGNFTHLPISYGPTPDNIKGRRRHELCLDGKKFMIGFVMSWFAHFKLPTAEERCIYIDMLANIRAIYLPLSQSACEAYPSLCSFVTINFAHNGKLQIWDSSKYVEIQCDPTFGLRANSGRVLAIDVYGLLNLLSLPRNMRSQTPYSAKLLQWTTWGKLQTVPVLGTYLHRVDFDWIAVAKANLGLSLQWVPAKPASSPWWKGFIKNIATIAVGFVPGVGPILAVGTALMVTWVLDPDKFLAELRAQVPTVELGEQVFNKFRNDAKQNHTEQMKYVNSEWKNLVVSSRSLSEPESEPVEDSLEDSPALLAVPVDDIPPSTQFISNGYTLASSVRTISKEEIEADRDDGAPAQPIINPSENSDDGHKEPYNMDPSEIPNESGLLSDIDWIQGYTSIQFREKEM